MPSAHARMNKKVSFDDSLMPPCQMACPLHMEIGEYVDLIAQGRILEALQVIRAGNPFPSICAYVCTHPCEDACRRGQVDNPVGIRALKRFAIEFGGDRMIQLEATTTHSERVAVVGSGPAGLAAAYYLRELGYPVTIFEAHAELGGMLRVGIPKYRLPREVLDNEVQRLTQMGVEIRSLRLGIEGEDSPGVVDGATFLREVNLGLQPSVGNSVAAVGGGNVALDAARTALRLGARDVKVLYRRSRAEMPADPAEVEQSLEEGVDIRFLVAPIKISREKKCLRVTCQRFELGEPDASGRRRPVTIPNSEFNLQCDTLITAIGQSPGVPEDFRVRIGKGSTIQVDPVTLLTNRSGVFAGGDAVTGPATVTEALAAGRQAAHRIDEYLQHRYPLPARDNKDVVAKDLLPRTVAAIRKAYRLEPERLAPQERVAGFRPVELIYDWGSAVNEARRCLRCGMGAEILFQDHCATCLNCVRICPYHVPYVDASGMIQIPSDQCQACGICVAECPANAIVLRKPRDRRHIAEELAHLLQTTSEDPIRPLIVGFACQYGLFGTGTLANLRKEAHASISIVPVLCVATVEPEHVMHAFEMGADGVFIAGCGEQCARENTASWALRRVEKVRKALGQLGLEPERVRTFNLHVADEEPIAALHQFTQRISQLHLGAALSREVSR